MFPPLCQDILEGGNLWTALQELQQIIATPIKAYSSLQASPAPKEAVPERLGGPPKPSLDKPGGGAEDKAPLGDSFQAQPPAPGDGESATAPIPEGDIPGQFTRVMGKGEGAGRALGGYGGIGRLRGVCGGRGAFVAGP